MFLDESEKREKSSAGEESNSHKATVANVRLGKRLKCNVREEHSEKRSIPHKKVIGDDIRKAVKSHSRLCRTWC